MNSFWQIKTRYEIKGTRDKFEWRLMYHLFNDINIAHKIIYNCEKRINLAMIKQKVNAVMKHLTVIIRIER